MWQEVQTLMKIVEVNCVDLPGRLFNGYDLHIELQKNGYDTHQIVRKKYSDAESVIECLKDDTLFCQLKEWEKEHSVSHVMMPYGYEVKNTKQYKEADIVHYHILHNHMISLFDYVELMSRKGCIWTVHDPWIVTGNCIHPLDCDKWLTGCGECQSLYSDRFSMDEDNTSTMWAIKKKVLTQINPTIVVASEFMKYYIEKSPLTKHFDKVEVIPFGIKVSQYKDLCKEEKKEKFGIIKTKTTIGFRADDVGIKGCKYLYDALNGIMETDNIQLICVGNGRVPDSIKKRYEIIELGWVTNEANMIDFLGATDLFIMPSLAEGFGVMAIEAMAAGCAVVCFQGTTVAEITKAPKCGVAVEYMSVKRLQQEIERLISDKEEIIIRGKYGKELVEKEYRFETYVERHIKLYEKVYSQMKG